MFGRSKFLFNNTVFRKWELSSSVSGARKYCDTDLYSNESQRQPPFLDSGVLRHKWLYLIVTGSFYFPLNSLFLFCVCVCVCACVSVCCGACRSHRAGITSGREPSMWVLGIVPGSTGKAGTTCWSSSPAPRALCITQRQVPSWS